MSPDDGGSTSDTADAGGQAAPGTPASPREPKGDSLVPPCAGIPSILLISPHPEDHVFVTSILEPGRWKMYRACSYHEALQWLVRDHMTVIICESHLPDGTWKDILSQAQILPDPPCVIVAAPFAEALLWAEVLNLGGYDVLAKPFMREEVARVAELASMNFRREVEDRASAELPGRDPKQGTPASGYP
jgi:DNA-binding response OmpR family regulator